MKTLSIKLKLAGAFAVLLVIIVALGLYAVGRISAVNDLTAEMGDSWVPSIQLAGAMNTTATRARVAEARIILADSDSERERVTATMAERVAAIADLRKQYEPVITSPEERALYNDFVAAWDQYLAQHKRIIAALDRHDRAAAEAMFGSDSVQVFDRVAAKLNELVVLNKAGADAANKRGDDIYANSRNLVVGGVVVVVLLTVAAGFFLIVNVSLPIAGMTQVMARLADNDFSVVIPATDRGDELGAMAQAVAVFKEKMEANRRMEAEVKEAEKRAGIQRKKDMNKLADDFDASVKIIVNAVASAANEMQSSAQSLASVAEQTHRQSASVAAAAEQASANVQTVAAATGELSASISEIGRQVEVSSRVAGGAVDEAQRVSAMVTHLSEAAAKIGDVVSLINDIASQTNLLALNATIEAARAGEAGKGFAVVASEVKSLANQTAKATDEIGQQIASVQSATKEAVEAIGAITRTIGQINEIAGSIAAAVEEQAAATQEIARNVQQAAQGTTEVTSNIAGVNQASTETGSAAGQVLGAARELSEQAEHLHTDVDRFIATVRAA